MGIGFAFIEFEDPRDADDAVRDMDGRTVCGVRIRVEMAKNSNRYNNILTCISISGQYLYNTHQGS